MSVQHTPGPWAVNPWNAQVDSGQVCPSGEELIPVCQMLWPTDLRSEGETQANAQLVSAAPRLLIALEEVLHWDARRGHLIPYSVRDPARSAIAKARGEA
jgi:hypothetical protein